MKFIFFFSYDLPPVIDFLNIFFIRQNYVYLVVIKLWYIWWHYKEHWDASKYKVEICEYQNQ